jgi:hypothetical protein
MFTHFMAKLQKIGMLFFILLMVMLSIQVGTVQARSYSTIEEDAIRSRVPVFTCVSLPDGDYKLLFPDRNETHYANGTIHKEFSVTLSLTTSISMSATSTKTSSITTIHLPHNDNPDQDPPDPFNWYFISIFKLELPKPETPFLGNWLYVSILCLTALTAIAVGIDLFMRSHPQPIPISVVLAKCHFWFKKVNTFRYLWPKVI